MLRRRYRLERAPVVPISLKQSFGYFGTAQRPQVTQLGSDKLLQYVRDAD